MSQLFHLPQAVRIDSTGAPYPGAKLYAYLTGTTTPTDTYTDSARATAHANPVIADSAGQWAPIYLDPAITYRFIITDQNDVQLEDTDPYGTPLTASDITVVDAGGYFADTEVESVLQDIGANYPKNASTETITAAWTFSGGINMSDSVLSRPEIKDFALTHSAITSSSNAITADCSTGNSFYHLLTENTTFTLSNPSATGKLCQIVVLIQQDGAGGAYTVTWPSSVYWAGGSSPTMSTGNDAIDKYTLSTIDAGTTWYGEFGQAYGQA